MEPTHIGRKRRWARENTRGEIFGAMKRKEVYATTGTRLLVRVFAGFDFVADDIQRHDFAKYGYQKGVPMSGDLSQAPNGKAPTLMIRALRDVDGANLDRVQIVKGWMDKKGKLHEKVYDVAWSDDREMGADGKLPPVGNTVDVANASYTNTIGAPLLLAYWHMSSSLVLCSPPRKNAWATRARSARLDL